MMTDEFVEKCNFYSQVGRALWDIFLNLSDFSWEDVKAQIRKGGPEEPVTVEKGKITAAMVAERMKENLDSEGNCKLPESERWGGKCLTAADVKALVGQALGVSNTRYVRPIIYEAWRQGLISDERLNKLPGYEADESKKCSGGRCLQENRALKVDEAERIVSGPVLVPGEPDLDGDIVTVEEVERAAYKFLEDYQNIDIMHNFRNVARPVESYILREDTVMEGVHLPRGTWMLSARIYDDSVWEGVRKGEYTGFSITAVPAAVKQKTTLRDLGGEWEVVTVSIVTNPAVPKARYLTVKGGENVDEKSVLKSIFESLKQYFESSPTMKEEEDVTDDGGAAMDVNETLKAYEESIKELREEIRALKEALKEGEDPEGDAPAPDEAVDEPAEEEDDDGGAPEPEPAPKSRDWQVGDDGPAVKSVYDEIGVDAYGRRVRKD